MVIVLCFYSRYTKLYLFVCYSFVNISSDTISLLICNFVVGISYSLMYNHNYNSFNHSHGRSINPFITSDEGSFTRTCYNVYFCSQASRSVLVAFSSISDCIMHFKCTLFSQFVSKFVMDVLNVMKLYFIPSCKLSSHQPPHAHIKWFSIDSMSVIKSTKLIYFL